MCCGTPAPPPYAVGPVWCGWGRVRRALVPHAPGSPCCAGRPLLAEPAPAATPRGARYWPILHPLLLNHTPPLPPLASRCKRNEVPIEKVFNKSLLTKFLWAMDVEPDFRF